MSRFGVGWYWFGFLDLGLLVDFFGCAVDVSFDALKVRFRISSGCLVWFVSGFASGFSGLDDWMTTSSGSVR